MPSIEITEELYQKIEKLKVKNNDYNHSEIAIALIEIGIDMAERAENAPNIHFTDIFSRLLLSSRGKCNPQSDNG